MASEQRRAGESVARELIGRARMTAGRPVSDRYSIKREDYSRDEAIFRMTLMKEAVVEAGEPETASVTWFPDEEALVIDLSGGVADA